MLYPRPLKKFFNFFSGEEKRVEQIKKSTLPKQVKYADEAKKVSRVVTLMTTPVEFTIITDRESAAQSAITEAIEEIRRVERVMSEWRSDSMISKINKSAGIKEIKVSRELFMMLESSVEISEATDGKFDVTAGSVVKLWDFRAQRIPTKDEINNVLPAVDYKNIVLNKRNSSVYIKDRRTKVGLGGIAKGYAVDRAVDVIKKRGFAEFSVNAGGDLFVVGDHQGKPWKVGLQHPRDPGRIIALIPVTNAAVLTSGDYERYFEKDGVRYSHILDPGTGMPARLCQSVTVLAPRTYIGDAVATGVFILGPERGMSVIEKLPGFEAIFVDADGELHVSSGLPDLSNPS